MVLKEHPNNPAPRKITPAKGAATRIEASEIASAKEDLDDYIFRDEEIKTRSER